MAKKKTKRRVFGVIIFFLVPFFMGLAVGVIIGAKFFNKKPTNTEEKITNKVVIDDKLTESLFNVVNNQNLEKVLYNYRANGVELKNIENDEKLYLAGIDNYYKNDGEWVTLDALKENLNNNYNTDFGVEGIDYNFHDITVIKYDEGSYSYNGEDFTYADNNMYIDFYKSLELINNENNYYLTVVGIYHQNLKNEEKFTNDKGFIVNDAVSAKTTLDDLYKTNPEQFMKYTFVFEKANNEYRLIKFQKNILE